MSALSRTWTLSNQPAVRQLLLLRNTAKFICRKKSRNLELLQVLGGGKRLESAVDSARGPAGLGGARAGECTFFRSAILQNPRD